MKGGPETELSKNPWQNLPRPPPEFPCSDSHSPSLCRRQPAPGLALPSSGRANQPRASALAPFPVSACRLLALSEGQLSAVRPTLPPANSHKEPSVLGGRGEVRRNRRSIHKNTLLSVRLEAAYRELLAVPGQISASLRDTWVSWHSCWLRFLSDSKLLEVITPRDSHCVAEASSYLTIETVMVPVFPLSWTDGDSIMDQNWILSFVKIVCGSNILYRHAFFKKCLASNFNPHSSFLDAHTSSLVQTTAVCSDIITINLLFIWWREKQPVCWQFIHNFRPSSHHIKLLVVFYSLTPAAPTQQVCSRAAPTTTSLLDFSYMLGASCMTHKGENTTCKYFKMWPCSP